MLIEVIKLEAAAFDFLTGFIADYGLFILMGFVYLLIPFAIWALGGGLRRTLLKGKPMPRVPPVIVIQFPGAPPPRPEAFDPFPPLREPPDCDHDCR